MTALLLNRAHYPVTTLGPGRRAGIWVQGCTIGCPGCMSTDTWPSDPARAIPATAVLDWVDALPARPDGITLSGGEPFQQVEAVTELLGLLHEWRAGSPIDILVYSGYPFHRLRKDAAARRALALCDAAVTGPYLRRRPTDLPWRGSANQRLIPLTPLGKERYATTQRSGPRLQVCPDGDTVWLIGVPAPGDLELLAGRLEHSGLRLGQTTWRPANPASRGPADS